MSAFLPVQSLVPQGFEIGNVVGVMILYGTLDNQLSICGQIDPLRPVFDYE